MSNAKSLVKAFTATVGLILVVGIITASAQTSQFVSMMRNARVFFADGTTASPSITFANDPTIGFFRSGTSQVTYVSGSSTNMVTFNGGTSNLALHNTANLGWVSSGGSTGTVDTILCRGAANVIGIGGCTSSFPAIKRNAAQLDIRLGDDSNYANLGVGSVTSAGNVSAGSAGAFRFSTTLLMAATAPTISSGFGTSATIPSNNGTSSFRINVGTGGVATSGVIGLPAAANGWNCFVQDMTNNTVTRMTASTTTTATFTAAAAWAASDILSVSCFGY
jgi:hypothetical protein